MLADEHIGFVVNAGSPIRSGHDLVERLKKDPESVSMALEKNSLTPVYLGSEATRRMFAQQADQLRAVLTDLGLAK